MRSSLLLLTIFLCGCSEFSKGEKAEKDGDKTLAAAHYEKFLTENPTNKQKIILANIFLGKQVLAEDSAKANAYFDAARAAGGNSSEIDDYIVQAAEEHTRNKAYDELRKLSGASKNISQEARKKLETKLAIATEDEKVARAYILAAKDSAEARDLAQSREYLDKATVAAPKSAEIIAMVKVVENIFAMYKAEEIFTQLTSDIETIYDVRYTNSKNPAFTKKNDEIENALLRINHGEDEFEKKRDEPKIEERYQKALAERILVKYAMKLPPYDFNSQTYTILTTLDDLNLTPRHVSFGNIRVAPEIAEKIKKDGEGSYIVEFVIQPDHLLTREESKNDFKNSTRDIAVQTRASSSEVEQGAEMFVSRFYNPRSPGVVYKVIAGKCEIKRFGTLYVSF